MEEGDREQLLQSTNQALSTLNDRLEALARQRAQRQTVIPDKFSTLPVSSSSSSSSSTTTTNGNSSLLLQPLSLTANINDDDNVSLSGRTNTRGSAGTVENDEKSNRIRKDKETKAKSTRTVTTNTSSSSSSSAISLSGNPSKVFTPSASVSHPKPLTQTSSSRLTTTTHTLTRSPTSSVSNEVRPVSSSSSASSTGSIGTNHNDTNDVSNLSSTSQPLSVADLINAVAEADAKLEELERKRSAIALERAIFRATESARLREQEVRKEQIRMARLQLAMRGKNHKGKDTENNKDDDDNDNNDDNLTVQSMFTFNNHHHHRNVGSSSRSVMTSLGRSSTVSFATKPPTGKGFSSSASVMSHSSVKSYVRYSDLPPPDRSRPPLRKNSLGSIHPPTNNNDSSASSSSSSASNGPVILNLSRLTMTKVGNTPSTTLPYSNQESHTENTLPLPSTETLSQSIPFLNDNPGNKGSSTVTLQDNNIKRNTIIPPSYLKEGPYQEAFMAYEKILSANTTDILYNSNLPHTNSENRSLNTDTVILSKDDEEKLKALLNDIPTETNNANIPKQVMDVKFRQ